VCAQPRAPRPRGSQPDGQHFLRSALLADELIEQANVRPDDLVVEIGAGAGALTRPIAERAGLVIAVERDPALADALRSGSRWPNVRIVEANALRVGLPREPFRVIGNLPFAFGTRILRRLLDDAASPLQRVDAMLQFEAARKRAAVAPSTLVSVGWLPWWEFRLVRRIPRTAFLPTPSVDAGMLVIHRREHALLPAARRPAFVRMVARGFATPDRPIRRTFPDVPGWARRAAERGLPRDARPTELDVFDWIALFELRGG
jgi:23S rRNA (adenine-N6)-dimethyltransferase